MFFSELPNTKEKKTKKKNKNKKKQKKSIYPNSPFKDSFCVFDAYMHLFIIYVIDLLHVKNPPKQFFSELPDTKKKTKKKQTKKNRKKIYPPLLSFSFDASTHLYMKVCPSIVLPLVCCKN